MSIVEEKCGQETRTCECGHDVFDHRRGACLECDCPRFTGKPCRNLIGRCPPHDKEKYRQLAAERDRLNAIGQADRVEYDHDLGVDPAHCGIYFIRCESFVKIGLSLHAPTRLDNLQLASPFQLSLVGFIPCPSRRLFDLEREIHARFSELRRRGEWFRYEAPLIEFVESLKAVSQ